MVDQYEENPHYLELKNYLNARKSKAQNNKSLSTKVYENEFEYILLQTRLIISHEKDLIPIYSKIGYQSASDELEYLESDIEEAISHYDNSDYDNLIKTCKNMISRLKSIIAAVSDFKEELEELGQL